MKDAIAWQRNILGASTVEALRKNNFNASYWQTREEVIGQVLSLIPAEATVGIAGSVSVRELGLERMLEAKGHIVYNFEKPGLSADEVVDIRRKQLTCDVLLTSTNAVTLDGKLVNVDGTGNRVAAMIFGPKKVIVVAGVNKIVKDVSAAEARIRDYVAPVNVRRRGKPNPCQQTGGCMDCSSPGRICNVATTIHKKPPLSDIHVLVIGEELGL